MSIRDQAPRAPDLPKPGWYRTRLAKGGPWVPARIMEFGTLWLVLLDGEPTQAAANPDPWKVHRMEWVNFSTEISEVEYDRLLATRRALPADSPLRDPMKPVDWLQVDTRRRTS